MNAFHQVLDDADLQKAARAIVYASIVHSGQACISTERVIIQRKASETLIPLIVNLMKRITAGDPENHPVTALFNEASAIRVIDWIRQAQHAGAKLLVGDGTRNGSLIQPHVLADVKPGMTIWDRESFGPGAFQILMA